LSKAGTAQARRQEAEQVAASATPDKMDDVIDGRAEVAALGDRKIPVWGEGVIGQRRRQNSGEKNSTGRGCETVLQKPEYFNSMGWIF